MNEPIADAIRAILDGHVVLTRELASQNHYPSIDILNSISRLMIDVAGPDHNQAGGRLRDVLAAYKENEDLINIGAYVPDSNPRIDHALAMIEPVRSFLKQGIDEKCPFDATLARLVGLFPAGKNAGAAS